MNELIYDRFERYNKGLLSSYEKQALETELEHDQGLKRAYQDYLKGVEAIDVSIEADLRLQINEWERQNNTNGSFFQKAMKLMRWVLIFAILTVISMIGVAFYQSKYVDQLIKEAFEPYTLQTAMADQANGQLSSRRMELADIKFSQSQYQEAIQDYVTIQQSQDTDIELRQLAEFHESLALYHSKGRHPGFDKLLNVIAQNPDHLKHEEAARLRDHLDRFLVKLIKG